MDQLKKNRWALVTGASSGIGEAFAVRFAQEGWNVALVARSVDKLKTLAAELEKKYQIKTFVVCADLSAFAKNSGQIAKDGSCEALAKEDYPHACSRVYEEVRGAGVVVDCLVNNAGFGAIGSFTRLDLHRQLEMIDVNIKSLVALTHLFLPGMLSQKSGFIINVSSTAGFQPMPYFAVYAATKAFVSSFSEAVSAEFSEQGVRVMNLCPGRTETNFGNVAGFHHHPLDKRPIQTSGQVVDEAFRQLFTKKAVVISGFHNRVMYYLERLTTRNFVVQILKRKFKEFGYNNL